MILESTTEEEEQIRFTIFLFARVELIFDLGSKFCFFSSSSHYDGVTPSWYVRLGHTCRCEQGY